MDLQPFEFLVIALATWRVSYMIAVESGPFKAFEIIRAKIPLGGLTTCIYCLSVWVACLMYLMWSFDVTKAIVVALGVSGAAMMLWRQTGGQHVK